VGQFITSFNTLQHNSYIPSSDMKEQINTATTKPHHPCTLQSKCTRLKNSEDSQHTSCARLIKTEHPNSRSDECKNFSLHQQHIWPN